MTTDFFSTSFLFSVLIIMLVGGIFVYVNYKMSEQDHKLSSMVSLVSMLAQDLQYIKNKVNGFVIFTIIKYKQLHNNTTMCYLFNLTISNISYLIFCVLITAITYLVDSWPFGSLFCKCYHYLSFVTVCSTCMSLMAMTIGIYLIFLRNYYMIYY